MHGHKQAKISEAQHDPRQGQGRAQGPAASRCTAAAAPVHPGPVSPPAQRPGRSREQRPVKKVILSLKINDPLVTKAGNVPLSPHSEKVVEQAAPSDLKSKRNTTHSAQCLLSKHS